MHGNAANAATFDPQLDASVPVRRLITDANVGYALVVDFAVDEVTVHENGIHTMEIYYYLPTDGSVRWVSSRPDTGDSIDDQQTPPQMRKVWRIDARESVNLQGTYRMNLALTIDAEVGDLDHRIVMVAYGSVNGNPRTLVKETIATMEILEGRDGDDNAADDPLKLTVLSSPGRYAVNSERDYVAIILRYSIDVAERDRLGATHATVYYTLPTQGMKFVRSTPLSYFAPDENGQQRLAFNTNVLNDPIGQFIVYMEVWDSVNVDDEIIHLGKIELHADSQNAVSTKQASAETLIIDAPATLLPESSSVGEFVLRMSGEPEVIDIGDPNMKMLVVTVDYRFTNAEIKQLNLHDAALFYYVPSSDQIMWQRSEPASGDSIDDTLSPPVLRKHWEIDLKDSQKRIGTMQIFFKVSEQQVADVVAHKAVLKAEGLLNGQPHTFTSVAKLTTPVISGAE